ncbi:MAG TPA: phosphatase PAP2 family protein [Solirubrobacterales bacterium]
MSRLVHSTGGRLPRGWRDLLRQAALFFIAYNLYQVVRGVADGRHAVAIANGLHVMHLERSLGAFFEPGFQQAFLAHEWVIEAANWMYFNSHFVITTAFLVWLYLFRNENFNFVRNMFLAAMCFALVGYLLFPTAPPRMFPSAGFTDTITVIGHTNHDSSLVGLLVNPYAAVPSMHIAFSLMISVPAMNLVRSAWARALWSTYPLVVFFVIVVTANHFWFDAAAGAAVACMAAVTAHQLARLRPDAWSWGDDAIDQAPA